MAFNLQRTARMASKSDAQLLIIWKAKSLSSAAAAYELKRRGVPLSKRE